MGCGIIFYACIHCEWKTSSWNYCSARKRGEACSFLCILCIGSYACEYRINWALREISLLSINITLVFFIPLSHYGRYNNWFSVFLIFSSHANFSTFTYYSFFFSSSYKLWRFFNNKRQSYNIWRKGIHSSGTKNMDSRWGEKSSKTKKWKHCCRTDINRYFKWLC